MMRRYRLEDQAHQDLADIWLTIAQDRPSAADRLLDTFYERFMLLADQPEIGRLRPELAPNLRSVPVGNYIIFYRPFSEGIEVARVLHGARDVESIFRG